MPRRATGGPRTPGSSGPQRIGSAGQCGVHPGGARQAAASTARRAAAPAAAAAALPCASAQRRTWLPRGQRSTAHAYRCTAPVRERLFEDLRQCVMLQMPCRLGLQCRTDAAQACSVGRPRYIVRRRCCARYSIARWLLETLADSTAMLDGPVPGASRTSHKGGYQLEQVAGRYQLDIEPVLKLTTSLYWCSITCASICRFTMLAPQGRQCHAAGLEAIATRPMGQL